MRLAVVSAGIALLIAAVAFVSYEILAYRRAMVREMTLIADMVEIGGSAALTFEDAPMAESALKLMAGNRDVISAFLYSESGHFLAGYQKDGVPPVAPPAVLGADRMQLTLSRFLMVRSLRLKDQKVGTLYLTADMSGLRRQFLWTGAIAAVISGLSFALALLICRRLQKALERPLVQLAETARAVSRGHDYGLRVQPHGADELGLLMEDFNQMLAGIQQRDLELLQYRENLEEIVRARTEQLERDMAERKSLEHQLFRAQRLESLGTLAGGVAHDLNNVLSPIMLSIEVLKDLSTNPTAQKMLLLMEASAKRGRDIVKQILTFARGTDGERCPIDFRNLVNEIISICQQTFPKSISVKCEMPAEMWGAIGDATQIHQLVLNLCVNARDALGEGGRLTLRVSNQTLDDTFAKLHLGAKAGRYLSISVEDSGCGMPPETLERIFEPFFTTKGVGKGTGLGLSTVHAIIQSHGGFVTCYSEVGRGTAFNVFLPVSAEASSQPAFSVDGSLPQGSGELVLVVDDEIFIRGATRHTLEAFGFRVMTAADGADAVKLYAAHGGDIAVVLTDMMMPNMDGRQTIQALRALNPEVRIIAASGIQRSASLPPDGAFEANAFLAKPFTAETLLRRLSQVLRG